MALRAADVMETYCGCALTRRHSLLALPPVFFCSQPACLLSKWCALRHHAHQKQLLKLMKRPFLPPVTRKQSISFGCPQAETDVEPNGRQELLSKCTWWPLVVLGGTANPASCGPVAWCSLIGKKVSCFCETVQAFEISCYWIVIVTCVYSWTCFRYIQ